jgi:low affinity Fe/Cu permease
MVRIPVHEFFRKFARRSAEILGSAEVFLLAVATIVIWAALGPRYHYSDTWQLVINTATSVTTFLMVFVIQNTQNRDAKAIHLKLVNCSAASGGRGPVWCVWKNSRMKN